MNLATYVGYLDQMGYKLRERVKDAQRTATKAAVAKAVERTAPNDGIPRGVNMVTGNMAKRWVTDSNTEPEDKGTQMETLLANNAQYASYANHGHWMYRHFVPGLYVDNGLVNRTDRPGIGLVVAKSGMKWVQGRYMEDAALQEYETVLKQELSKVGEIWK